MANKSQKRLEAYRLWRECKGNRLLKDIAEELGVLPQQIYKWKWQDKWSLTGDFQQIKPRRVGAPRGNKNAVGNKGGAPKGNKNAVKTGEYESILLNTLTDEEKQLIRNIHLNKIIVLREELMLLTIRERRMMQRIHELQKKASNGMGIAKVIKSEGSEPDVMGRMRDKRSTSTEIMPVLNTIQKIEEALTKVQGRKQAVVDQLHRIETDDKRYELELKRLELESIRAENANVVPVAEQSDDGFMQALEASTSGVWDDVDDDHDID